MAIHDQLSKVWLSLNNGDSLSELNKAVVISGEQLSDKHINFAHAILKKQFPSINGLLSTLLLTSCPSSLVPINSSIIYK